MPYAIGQTATNPTTGQKVQWDGQHWAAVPGTGTPGGGGKGKFSPQAQNFLNDLSKNAGSAREVGKLYSNVESSLKAIRPGPYRNRLLLSPAIPEDNGGILDAISGALIGGPARLTGAVTPKEVSNYQTVRAIQNAAVLERQLPQKGPQTESDAARMMLADISPGKDLAANERIINAGRQKIQREQARATFYTKFANKWGLNGVSPHGFTADELWAKSGDEYTKRLFNKSEPTTFNVISREKVP